VETGTVDDVFYQPSHPYAQGLLASLPRLDRRRDGERLYRIKGQPPSLIFLPPGCAFNPCCAYAMLNGGPCDIEVPQLLPLALSNEPGHLVACHLPERQRRDIYEQDIASVGVAL